MKKIELLLAAMLTGSTPLFAQTPVSFKVDLDQSAGMMSQDMWGLFFEDINMGADGGIYAELVKNRSFEFNEPWMGWKKLTKEPEGTFLIVNNSKRKGNPRSLKIHNPKGLQLGVQNEGFRGMGIKKGEQYEFSLLFKEATA